MAYVTVNWMDYYPILYVYHEPIIVSDHATIVYVHNKLHHQNRRPYQVENWCLLIQR